MRRRMLSPTFFTDDDLVQHFDFRGRLFYQGLWCVAEDSGVYEPKLLALKMKIFPGDDIPLEVLQDYLNKLIQLEKVVPYEAGGKKLHWLKNFHRHQKVDRPSPPTLPLPPWITWHGEEEFGNQRHRWYYEIRFGGASFAETSATAPGKQGDPSGPEVKINEVSEVSEVKESKEKQNNLCSGRADAHLTGKDITEDETLNKGAGCGYPPEFEAFWQAYPKSRRREKQAAYRQWLARLKQDESLTPEILIDAAKKYAAEMEVKKKDPEYIKLPKTFLGPARPFEDYLNLPDGQWSVINDGKIGIRDPTADCHERKGKYVHLYKSG